MAAGGGGSAVIIDNRVAAKSVSQPVTVAESAPVAGAAPVLRRRQPSVRAADYALRSIPTVRAHDVFGARADEDGDEPR